MSALRLLDHPDSPNCRKVRLLLAAAQVPFERQEIDLHRGGTRDPAFVRLAPAGKIPVLVDGPHVLVESNAILVHLARRYAPALWGSTMVDQTKVLGWLFWQASGATTPVATVSFQRLIRPARGEDPDEARVREGLVAWQRPAELLEQQLARSEWLLPWLSIADIALGAWIEIATQAGMLDDRPRMRRWIDRLQELPWWRAAAPYEILGSTRWRPSSSSNASAAV